MTKRQGIQPDPDAVEALADQIGDVCATLRAMANETRLRILCVLFDGEMPADNLLPVYGRRGHSGHPDAVQILRTLKSGLGRSIRTLRNCPLRWMNGSVDLLRGL